MEEQKTQTTPAEEEKEEKTPETPQVDQEKEGLKKEVQLYRDRAAKWQRKHDEVKETKETPPEPAYSEQGDLLVKLREKYDEDPVGIAVGMADRAGRHYAEQVRVQLKKETKAKRQLARTYKDFDEYEDRVDEFMEKMPLDKRTPDMFEMAYKVAKTEKIEDLEKIKTEAKAEGKEEGKAESLEEAKDIHTASIPRGALPKETKTTVKLSDEEQKMAARFGMTPDKYAEWKNKTKITGGEKAKFVQT
ncbi:unnamed protein product [marine sediment metagenome]|uniref:Uncharacterized protein n=1 Tax=marine sediment metagenome TaxID=412755 RepID=X1N7G2_9ZZZZ